jgi:hypothetical protein
MKLENVPVTGQDFAISRWMSIVGKALTLGGLGLLTLFGEQTSLVAALGLVIGPLCVLGSYASRVVLPPMRGSIEVRPDAVVVRTHFLSQTIPRRRVRSAYVVMRKHEGVEKPAVEIRTRGRNLHRIFVADVATGHALVDALGCAPGGKSVRLEMARGARRLLHPLLALGATMLAFLVLVFTLFVGDLVVRTMPRGAFVGFLFCVVAAVIYELLKKGRSPPVVTIGSDGIEVQRGFQTKRVRREEIVRVGYDREEGALVVLRRGARSVVVAGAFLDRALLEVAAAEYERRLATTTQHPRAASFERAARGIAEWKTGLRATLDAGYRAAGVTVDDATSVLQSASASPEQRVGAALALRVAGEPPERIRVAAESVVDPKLRVAIEAIAEDEDDRLERTLKTLR